MLLLFIFSFQNWKRNCLKFVLRTTWRLNQYHGPSILNDHCYFYEWFAAATLLLLWLTFRKIWLQTSSFKGPSLAKVTQNVISFLVYDVTKYAHRLITSWLIFPPEWTPLSISVLLQHVTSMLRKSRLLLNASENRHQGSEIHAFSKYKMCF